MKNILITGADGFIGSHLAEMLFDQGYKIKVLVSYNSNNHWGWLENLECRNKIKVVSGDIRDLNFCHNLVKDTDTIFHLAALIAIPYSYLAPSQYVETNITGTLNICQAAKEKKIRVIHTSTSEVYGSAEYTPIDENHPLKPQSPYSASKIGADAIAMSYYYSFELPITIARPFNTYGPRQSARAVIPTIITQIAGGRSEIKLGDTSTTRDFNYVEDTCRALISIAKSKKTLGEVINIGSNEEISIKKLFNTINELMGNNSKLVTDSARLRPKTSEVLRLKCDNSKLINLTKYKPMVSLKEGLKITIKWFQLKENLGNYKIDIYNI